VGTPLLRVSIRDHQFRLSLFKRESARSGAPALPPLRAGKVPALSVVRLSAG